MASMNGTRSYRSHIPVHVHASSNFPVLANQNAVLSGIAHYQGQAATQPEALKSLSYYPLHASFHSVPSALQDQKGDSLTQLYGFQVQLATQLHALQTRLQETQAKVEASEAKNQQADKAIRCLQSKVTHLEEVLGQGKGISSTNGHNRVGREDVFFGYPSNETFVSVNGAQPSQVLGPLRNQQGPWATLSSSTNGSLSPGSGDSPNSSIGAPGSTLIELSPASKRVDGKPSLLTPGTTPRAAQPHFQGILGEVRANGMSSEKAKLAAWNQPPFISAPVKQMGLDEFRARLCDLFQSTETFARSYTKCPSAGEHESIVPSKLSRLLGAVDSETACKLVTRTDARYAVVARIMNQFLTRNVLFYEVVRGFDSTADSEIRQLLELLYSDTPGAVRSLFYTHLANQVLRLRNLPSFIQLLQARQSSNANDLFNLVAPLLRDTPSSPASLRRDAHPVMRLEFLKIIQSAHTLGIDMISGAHEFDIQWPSSGDNFEPGCMCNRDAGIIGHRPNVVKEGKVKLAMSPAIWLLNHAHVGNDGRVTGDLVTSAHIILQSGTN